MGSRKGPVRVRRLRPRPRGVAEAREATNLEVRARLPAGAPPVNPQTSC